MFIVMRSPCLIEDEGRHFFIGTFTRVEDAYSWIASQKGSYFGPSNYYVITERGQDGNAAAC